MRPTVFIIAVALLSGCDSSIEGVQSFPSPDGRHVLQVVTELQAANDPAPWWQHICLRKPGASPTTRGSIASFEGHEPVEVAWTSPTEVRVGVPAQLLRRAKLPSATTRDGVKIEFHTSKGPSAANTPNQAIQRTAGRSVFQVSMTSTFNLQRCALPPAVADLASR